MEILRQKRFYSFSMASNFLKICFLLFILISTIAAALVQMRVVKDTANYGYFGNNLGDLENNQLLPKASPANFSGPLLLQRLLGKCYNLTEDRYQYKFCPFQNITQFELSARWNAYQGILGIWSHWNIKNNSFSLMVYSHGDPCGDIDRSVTVHLQCGPKESLSNVTEPKKCQYEAIFSTRYACHDDALLVYPRLEPKFQKRWDKLLTNFHYGDITEKGYEEGLKLIFEQAGLMEISTKPPDTPTSASLLEINTFVDLLSCNKEFKNLQNEISQLNQEIEALKLLIDINKIENRTNKPQKSNLGELSHQQIDG